MDMMKSDDASEAVIDDEDYNDDTAFHSESCGICTDVVIDRGVLDCCSHWFCFTCIDNWAAITNLCPLCKNEFQLITCLPVYDTIGNIKFEEHSFPRDDDFFVQGTNNTLSFPSYYIDEDAVVCLDGDGCKIRSGLAACEEDLTFDTSIACDSCDIWYHAFCVAFNPEHPVENSWLCPRCITNGAQQKPDEVSMENLGKHSSLANAHLGCGIDTSFSGKVSVSVADAGETAVVVSMVEEKQIIEVNQTSSELTLDIKTEDKLDAFTQDISLEMIGAQRFQTDDELEGNSIIIPPLQVISPCKYIMETPSPLSLCLDIHGDSKASTTEETKCHTCDLSGYADDSVFNLPCDLPGVSSFPVEEVNDVTKNRVVSANSVCSSELFSVPEDKMVIGTHEETIDVKDQENFEVVGRKDNGKCQSQAIDVDHVNKHIRKRERDLPMKVEATARKSKSDRKSHIPPSRSKINTSVSEKSHRSSRTAPSPKDFLLSHVPQKQATATDIMTLVKETDRRSNSSPTGPKPVGMTTNERNNSSAPRVKKIIRRTGDKKESSILVQNLRKEIKEAVQDRSSNNTDKNTAFDAKLLTAFRAAIVKPRNESVNKFSPSLVAKKSLIQKGKVRENLTKKIYASSSGRRRRAWDREWEIEFWKHRCKKMKPEKVETLQSVLELLKKATMESSEMDQGPEGESEDILSNVYLADTSVFPRKDDIKPLSVLNLEKDKELGTRSKKDSLVVHGNNIAKSPSGISKVMSCISAPRSGPSSTSLPSSSKGREPNLKDPASQSHSSESDKRKWALEVLARKNALMNLSASKENQEDNAAAGLKGTYPLLAQLPIDMRPVIEPNRHTKVPVSARQAQVNRITENYLKRANLPFIHRTANTELAVADAVNVEKDIFKRSSSKLVYMNLCSQFLSQLAKKPQSAEPDLPATTTANTDQAGEKEVASFEPAATFNSEVEEALRLAGLLDSPPESPCRPFEATSEQDPSRAEVALENVLDLGSHPELDIYGDFEYDLEDEGYTDPSRVASALGVLKSQSENGDSRMKVILTTLKHDPPKPQREIEVPSEPSTSADASVEVRMSVPSLQEEIYKEPSLAEYEELYGPEKEPLVERMSSVELIGGPCNAKTEAAAIDKAEDYRLKEGITMSEFETEGCAENSVSGTKPGDNESHGGQRSPTHSLMGENAPKEGVIKITIDKASISSHFVSKKVEAYIKEHIRPLCKSGVITVGQYQWAVGKTTEKVMRYHAKDKNANFLIKEGVKVKKLAEQYVEAAQKGID